MPVVRGHAESASAIDEAHVLDTVQALLRASLHAAPWPPALVAVTTAALAEPMRALGGRLTPWVLFPLCCCAAACGDWRPALSAATAAELYVAALDLYDDIEDGDRSVIVERYGLPIALNAATALLALAHTVLQPAASAGTAAAHRRAQDALWEGLAVATGGQHLDLSAAGGAPLSVDECLDIARRKGGALVEACCRAGAAFGTDHLGIIGRCGQLGSSLGLLAQLDNDMHDAEDSRGKSDVTRLKQTVPIAIARRWRGQDSLDAAVWQGGIQLTYALIHAERARARTTLEDVAALCPDPPYARAALGLLLPARGVGRAAST
jgi:geranylgeranyl pyrophosphate synthase